MGPTELASDFNSQVFVIRQIIGKISTATLVQVKAVTTNGAVAPVGFVDVLPLVNLLDGIGTSSKHGTVHNLPYFRLQGGQNAIIIDPIVGDLGLAIFADRDISTVKTNKAQANPGSQRRFDMADGLYIGGFLNQVPNQYIQFNSDGLKLVDKFGNSITMNASGINLTDKFGHTIVMSSGGTNITGPLTSNSTNISNTHVHSGVQTGGSNTGTPS